MAGARENSNWNTATSHLASAVGENEVILQNIFKYLEGEYLKVCRLVNKKWMGVVKHQFKNRMQVNFFERRCHDFRLHSSVEPNYPRKTTLLFFSSFRNADGRFLLDSFNFKFEAGLFRDLVNLEFLVLFGGGIKHLSVSVDQKNKWIQLQEIVDFRNHVLRHLTHLEELSVKFYVHLERTLSVTDSVAEELAGVAAASSQGVTLRALKSLRFYLTVYDNDGHPPRDEIEKMIKIYFASIINRTRNLECLAINLYPAKTETLLEMPGASLKKLKELRVNDWKCSDEDIRRSLSMLITMGEKGDLKLTSFALDFNLQYCPIHRHFCPVRMQAIMKLLFEFLTTQKDHLKSLRIKLARFTRDHIPFSWALDSSMAFPKMSRLEKLELSHSNLMFMPFFENGETWTELFPQLKELDYSCLQEIPESFIPRLVGGITTRCSTVTRITLNTKLNIHPNILTSNPLSPGFILTIFPCLYIAVQRNFPGLKILKINHQHFPMLYKATSERYEDIAAYCPTRRICDGTCTPRGGEVLSFNFEDDDLVSDEDSDNNGGNNDDDIGFIPLGGQNANVFLIGNAPPHLQQMIPRIVVEPREYNIFDIARIQNANMQALSNLNAVRQNNGHPPVDDRQPYQHRNYNNGIINIAQMPSPNLQIIPNGNLQILPNNNNPMMNAVRHRDDDIGIGEDGNVEVNVVQNNAIRVGNVNVQGPNAHAEEERPPYIQVVPGQPPSVLVGRFVAANRNPNPSLG